MRRGRASSRVSLWLFSLTVIGGVIGLGGYFFSYPVSGAVLHTETGYTPFTRYPTTDIDNESAASRTNDDTYTITRDGCIGGEGPQLGFDASNYCEQYLLFPTLVVEPRGATPSVAVGDLTSNFTASCALDGTGPKNCHAHANGLEIYNYAVLACKLKDPNDGQSYSDKTTFYPTSGGNGPGGGLQEMNPFLAPAPFDESIPVIGSTPISGGATAFWRQCRTGGEYVDPGAGPYPGQTMADKTVIIDADRPQITTFRLVDKATNTTIHDFLTGDLTKPFQWFKSSPKIQLGVFDASSVKVAEIKMSRQFRDTASGPLKTEYLSGVCRFIGTDSAYAPAVLGPSGTPCSSFDSYSVPAGTDNLPIPTWTTDPTSRLLMISNDTLLNTPSTTTLPLLTLAGMISTQEFVFSIPYDFNESAPKNNTAYSVNSITLHDSLSTAVTRPANQGATSYNPIGACPLPLAGDPTPWSCALRFEHSYTHTPPTGGLIGFGIDTISPSGASMGIAPAVGSVQDASAVRWIQGSRVPTVAPCSTGSFSVPIEVSMRDFGSRPKSMVFQLKDTTASPIQYYDPTTRTFITPSGAPPTISEGYGNTFFNPNVSTQRSGLTPDIAFSPPPDGYGFTFSPRICGIEEGRIYQIEAARAVDMAGNEAPITGLSLFAVDNTPPTGTVTSSCFMASGVAQRLGGTALEPALPLGSGLEKTGSTLTIQGKKTTGDFTDLSTTSLEALFGGGNTWSFSWPVDTKADTGAPPLLPFNGVTNDYQQYQARLFVKDLVGNTQTIDVPDIYWFDDNLVAGQYGIVKTFEGQTVPTGTEVEIRIFVKNRLLGKTEFTFGTASLNSSSPNLIQGLTIEDRLYRTFAEVLNPTEKGDATTWAASPAAIVDGYAVRAFRFSVSEPPAGSQPTLTLTPLTISNINACANTVSLTQTFSVRSPDLPLNVFGSLIGKTINLSRAYIGKIIEDQAGDEPFSGPAEWLRATIGQFLNPTSGTRSIAPASGWEEVTGN